MLGYWGKLLRINLSTGKIGTETIPDETLRKFLGGPGLAAELLLRELEPNTDPLSPENKLIFTIGPFHAVNAPGTAKWVVSTISPLTGGFVDSAGSGHWASHFKKSGYEMLVIEGKSDKPVYIHIDGDNVEIRDASELWGLDTRETGAKIKEILGDRRVCALNIGTAGEILNPIANIACDGYSWAGRGGTGAVMGSKNLKAISCFKEGKQTVPCANREEAEAFSKELFKICYEGGEQMRNFGTSGGAGGTEQNGRLPVRYWRGESFAGQLKKMYGPAMNEKLNITPFHCENCPIGCHRHTDVELPWGEYMKASGPEYECIGMQGSNVMVDDLFYIQKANDITNRTGCDHISAGAWVGFLMECYEYGWLTEDDFDGHTMKWGNGEDLVYATELVCNLQGIGKIFKGGIIGAAKELGGDAEKIIVHCKNLDYAAHDPRVALPMMVSYATLSRGSCHVRSGAIGYGAGNGQPNFDFEFSLDDRFDIEKAGIAAKIGQDGSKITNCLGICLFVVGPGFDLNNQIKMLKLLTDEDYTRWDMLAVGERSTNIERAINNKQGMRRVNDSIPDKMKFPALVGNRATCVPYTDEIFQAALSNYYDARGWTQDGVPTAEKFDELGLGDYVKYIPQN
ncbi:MAG: aldehyde ferredoxin oxidoreductase family protein [Oscillospiraceae bacterium]|nr:aldehyde ferredoxin oxidoreductase family protein [Oscillospiraceae bacterium]